MSSIPSSDAKIAARIFCPFFGHLNPGSITCEFLGLEHGVTIKFKTITHKYKTVIKWCVCPEGHKLCPIAAADYHYYGR